MKGHFGIGYRFDTRRVSDWNASDIEVCDVQAYARPGIPEDRIAAALERIAKRIRAQPDPNLIVRPL